MRLEARRHSLRILSESHLDLAYIEDTLGLRREGDSVLLIRRNLETNHDLSHLETSPHDPSRAAHKPRSKPRRG